MSIDQDEVRRQERETTDLPLSTLYRWQELLDVPVSELLVDSEATLSPPILERARLVKLMKTATAIAEQAERPAIRRMAQTLINQLVEIMPELKGVMPWHSFGQRRTLNDFGRAAERRLPLPAWAELELRFDS